ncbi:unnamed protein product [Trichogramma brassicae]|uniref:Uncharacterized protein n=1 Tax=Trichogramma brassicae TaxID=86971 RepID=A0A6H5HRZ0_9HYME|nr:unnamed protein product [Trichogramma brassicae]
MHARIYSIRNRVAATFERDVRSGCEYFEGDDNNSTGGSRRACTRRCAHCLSIRPRSAWTCMCALQSPAKQLSAAPKEIMSQILCDSITIHICTAGQSDVLVRTSTWTKACTPLYKKKNKSLSELGDARSDRKESIARVTEIIVNGEGTPIRPTAHKPKIRPKRISYNVLPKAQRSSDSERLNSSFLVSWLLFSLPCDVAERRRAAAQRCAVQEGALEIHKTEARRRRSKRGACNNKCAQHACAPNIISERTKNYSMIFGIHTKTYARLDTFVQAWAEYGKGRASLPLSVACDKCGIISCSQAQQRNIFKSGNKNEEMLRRATPLRVYRYALGTARGRYTYYAARKNSKKRSAIPSVEKKPALRIMNKHPSSEKSNPRQVNKSAAYVYHGEIRADFIRVAVVCKENRCRASSRRESRRARSGIRFFYVLQYQTCCLRARQGAQRCTYTSMPRILHYTHKEPRVVRPRDPRQRMAHSDLIAERGARYNDPRRPAVASDSADTLYLRTEQSKWCAVPSIIRVARIMPRSSRKSK